MIAQTPQSPYYAVIFTSIRTDGDNGYAEMSDKMEELAKQQPGYLGFQSAHSEIGISISYWDSLEAIKKWKVNIEHQVAQKFGREKWYAQFKVRICRVEREYGFDSGFTKP